MPDTPEYFQQAVQVQALIKAEFQDNGFDENREKTGLFATDYPNIEPNSKHPKEAMSQANGQTYRDICDLFVLAAAFSPEGTGDDILYSEIAKQHVIDKEVIRVVIEAAILTPKSKEQRFTLLCNTAELGKRMLSYSMQEPSQV